MAELEPMLMLPGDADGFGTRWLLGGQQVEPAIAGYLMRQGYIAETGATDFGAKELGLTATGAAFRREGLDWWAKLGFLQKLRIMLLG